MSSADLAPAAARVAGALLSSLLAAFAADAQDPGFRNDFRLRFSTGYSDNILRGAFSEESASYRGLGFLVSSARRGEHLEARFNGDIELRQYSVPTLDDEPVGSLNAFVGVDVVPERFQWLIEDSYGQARANQFIPVGPNNRQAVNAFTTGPRVTLPLGARTSLRIDGDLQRRRFKDTPQLDNDSEEVVLGVFRAVSQTTDVGLSWTSREITSDFVASAWEDDSVFLSYQRSLVSGSATVRLGENQVRIGGVEISGPLFDASWTREVGARSRVTVTAAQDFVDPGDRFRYTNAALGAGGLGAPLPTDLLLGAGVYELSNFSVDSVTSLDRTTFSFGGSLSESDYQSSTAFNNNSRGFSVSVDRFVSERFGIGLQANVRKIELLQLAREDTDRWTQLYLRHRWGRRLEFQFSYLRNSRDTPGFPLGAYDENQYQLTLLLDLNP